MLCVDNFSNQVDEEACRVNWEHTGVATCVKLYLRCIKPQRACLSLCMQVCTLGLMNREVGM